MWLTSILQKKFVPLHVTGLFKTHKYSKKIKQFEQSKEQI